MKKKASNSQKPQVLHRFTDIYVAGMLSVFLLYPGTAGYANITAHKAALFFLLSGIYGLGVPLLRLGLTAGGAAAAPKPKAIWRKMGLGEKLLLGYWVMTAISTALSRFPGTAFWGGARREGFVTISLYCLCCLWVSRYGQAKRWMLWLFAAAMCVNDALAIWQLAGGNPLGLYPDGMNYYDGFKLYAGQFLGTIGNVDLLSALLTVAIPVFWVAMLKMKGRRRFLLAVPLGMSLGVLFTAFVSGGVLGVTLGAVLTVPVVAKRGKGRRILAAGAGAMLLLAVPVVYFGGSYMGGFLAEAAQIMRGQVEDSFGSGRIYIWRKSLELAKELPLFGGGPETMVYRSDAVFERFDPELNVTIRSYVDTAHNEYLNVLVNQGIFAMTAFVGTIAAALVRWVKRAPDSVITASCGAAVLAYAVQALFGISSLVSAPFFHLALGFLLGDTGCVQSKATEEISAEKQGR